MTDTPWHARTVDETLDTLGARASGLTGDEARRRLGRHGPNRLAAAPRVGALRLFAAQFRGVVVLLLITAAAVSMLLGDRLQTIAIGVVIAVNAALGFVVELRARRAMESLLDLGAQTASVVRDGVLQSMDAADLVPGDIVELSSGQRVPADGRLLHDAELRMDEAALTGESLPVGKRAAQVLHPTTPLADRENMVYRGTVAAAGVGRVVVTATGRETEVGRVGALTASLPQERTPLERKLDALGRRLVWLSLGTGGMVAAIGLARGAPLGLMVETGIALAVAAVPEGLPAVATIALAIGLGRMARRRALVRRLPAVEALGSTTVICTDKTRTLTSGAMSIVRVWCAGRTHTPTDGLDQAGRALLTVAARASRSQAGEDASVGDPVDRAVLEAAGAAGVDDPDRDHATGLLPFSNRRKLMAAFHRDGDHLRASVKGAPQQVVDLSTRWRAAEGDADLDGEARRQVLDANARMAGEGLRVLAVAEGSVADADADSLRGLTFLGFVGLMDPPAAGVAEAIARLRHAGLRTVMLTGDQRLTAEAIGRQLRVIGDGDEALDSRDLAALGPDALDARLGGTGVFCRVTPEDKLTVVGALQRQGGIVAMLGDGVNDAPALRKADIGVAMGRRGTDVAREASAIVLEDDRFETVVAAVEEGRVIFDNIRKFVFFLFSCNLAEVLVLLVAGTAGLPLPMTPLQILWLNLVTDTLPALALALEPGDPDVMQRPPRDPGEALLSRAFLSSILFYAALITIATLAAFLWALSDATRHPTTVAFTTLVLAQIFHLATARSRDAVAARGALLSNRYAVGAVVISLALQVAALYVPPLPRVLAVSPLGATEWLVVAGLAVAPAVMGQVIRSRR